MPGYEVNFKIDKTIYIEDAPDKDAAKQKAAEHLTELLNRGVIEQSKIEVEEIKPEGGAPVTAVAPPNDKPQQAISPPDERTCRCGDELQTEEDIHIGECGICRSLKRRAMLWDDLKYSLEHNIEHENRSDKDTLKLVLTQMSNMEYFSTTDAQDASRNSIN